MKSILAVVTILWVMFFHAICANAESEAISSVESPQASDKTETSVVDAYRLATGDKIRIQVFGEDDLSLETTVSDTGKVSYPFLGEVKAAGHSVSELERSLTEGLKGPYLLDPKVTVSILEYRPFFISGQISRPGGYPFQPGLSLRKAIAIAGGLTEKASVSEVTIVRESDPQKKPQSVSLETPVYPGDSVSVPEFRSVYVNGEVKNPGGYEFKLGLTVRKAIALAGGFTPRAAQEKVEIIHEESVDRQPVQVTLDDKVQPGDIITIRQSFF